MADGKVKVISNLSYKELRDAYARCAFVVLSLHDVDYPAGITCLMEAMAMGKPVIATRVGGIPDIIVDGENGLLVPPGDALALRQAMQRLVNTPQLREQMGAASLRSVAEFQAKSVVSRIEAIYQRLCTVGANHNAAS